jgi:hypothetical protein
MTAEDDSKRADPVQAITSRITILGGLVAAIVAFNTSLTTCSNDNIERYKTFRETVKTEETYWKDLYVQYLDAFDPKKTPADQQKRKLQALSALAGHVPSDFSEHELGYFWGRDEGAKTAAKEHLESLRESLINALTDPEASGEEVATKAQAAIFDQEQSTILAPPKAETVVAPPAPTGQPSSSFVAKTLKDGESGGWNVDIFWCAGDSQGQYQTTASNIGARLTGNVPGTNSGLKTSRVRVRALPLSRQGPGSGYPSSGLVIRREASEAPAAQQLANYLSGLGIGTFTPEASTMKTPNYLSIFVCS